MSVDISLHLKMKIKNTNTDDDNCFIHILEWHLLQNKLN